MKELDVVRLKAKFAGLPIGTEGTIVLEYDGKDFEVESFDEDGDAIDVLTTPADVLEQIESLADWRIRMQGCNVKHHARFCILRANLTCSL